MGSDPRFTVIVPFFNARATIERTLTSLMGKGTDVEIVCVDDGSTDGSAALVEEKFKNAVRFVRQPHGGVSRARNRGMAEAKGEYLLFCDADDEFIPGAFDGMDVTGGEDVITFGAVVVNEDEKFRLRDVSPRDARYATDASEAFFRETGAFPFVWNHAFKRAFIEENALCFDETFALGEDLVFCFEAFQRAGSARFLSGKFYVYRHAGATSSERYFLERQRERLLIHVALMERLSDGYKKYGLPVADAFFPFYVRFLFDDCVNLCLQRYGETGKRVRALHKKTGVYRRADGKTKRRAFIEGHACLLFAVKAYRKIAKRGKSNKE